MAPVVVVVAVVVSAVARMGKIVLIATGNYSDRLPRELCLQTLPVGPRASSLLHSLAK